MKVFVGGVDADKLINPPLPLGTETEWGTIEVVGITGGERYYWMKKDNVVSMIPAFIVEKQLEFTEIEE